MKFVSFNTNGIRARLHQIEALVTKHNPDVIGIQETKVEDGLFPQADMAALGLHAEWFGQKGHYGVALLSREKPVWVKKGFIGDDHSEQKRLILAQYRIDGEEITVINGYFPQGESRDHPEKFPNKQRFYARLLERLQTEFTPDQKLVVMGDMNVAPVDQDIGIGPDNAKRWLRTGKCCFLPEEREWLQRIMDWGLGDTFRAQKPEVDDLFSWFDYRSKGFEREPKRGLRIDLILATKPLLNQLQATGIDYEIRSLEKPSDHCPVWAEFG
ncbi:MAG: exodeoxyribonuclease III [Alcanivorax sp.]|uniref:exodeoxyribonuclease III n=1 Tax=unclassified Ketobacter TaxID=2639109 RepID=UPI000C93B368|nr:MULTISPECIES: exodeoxyribonuclease III [unclassified Ketobacter]MAA59209.1 exodeoxyribonuclease III [Pseudomonadales bacterium]RLT91697.1 MAG: exodeoxyribonuclease III [Ketobacter sp. GenoA1]RLT96303.1 MAG: exodeoxyribonuclease III [Ketobacter sp.]TNC88346.1 MAG: exodeoxyribonuclease III [Alcanivorax sp.]